MWLGVNAGVRLGVGGWVFEQLHDVRWSLDEWADLPGVVCSRSVPTAEAPESRTAEQSGSGSLSEVGLPELEEVQQELM